MKFLRTFFAKFDVAKIMLPVLFGCVVYLILDKYNGILPQEVKVQQVVVPQQSELPAPVSAALKAPNYTVLTTKLANDRRIVSIIYPSLTDKELGNIQGEIKLLFGDKISMEKTDK